MAPIKFEEHIKDKLSKREIEPSERAWNEIASKLDLSQKAKTKPLYWYMIAAGFIGFLFISIVYFNFNNSPINTDVQIVNTPSDKIEQNSTGYSSESMEGIEENSVTSNEIESMEEKESNMTTVQLSTELIENQSSVQSSEVDFATNGKVDSMNENNNSLWEGSQEIINIKIAEVVAQVNLLEQNNVSVTNAEVDSLLNQAQKEILTESIFRKDNTVNATALLMEVEGELDKSFRDQIFESLKDGYLKVRTAVADRNN